MEFNELKSAWKASDDQSKNRQELQLMTKAMRHPKLKRIRRKLVIETILLTTFLALYYTALDGAEKPLWSNVILIIGAALFILNDTVGYYNLQNLVWENSIKQSLSELIQRLQRLSVLSGLSSLLFGASLIVFLTSTINFTPKSYSILLGMAITLFVFFYLNYRNWLSRISYIKESFEELIETK